MDVRDSLTVDDLPLVDLVLRMHPDLEFVLLAGIHARRNNLKYPLREVSDLKALFRGEQKSLVFRGHSVTYEQVLKFFPKEFFPIENEESFLRRALIALQRETLFGDRKLPPRSEQDVTFFDPAFGAGIPGAAAR
jgi:hypothetical protein